MSNLPQRSLLILAFLCLPLPPLLQAQDAAAEKLAPEFRYVDETRKTRSAKFTDLSTAKLSSAVRYYLNVDLEAEQSSDHRFRVHMEVKVTKAGDLLFLIPAWRPGSYRIQNYGRRILDFTAGSTGTVGTTAYEFEKVDDNSWLVKNVRKGKFTLDYALAAGRLKKRSRARNAKPCYDFHGPAMRIGEINHMGLPCQVKIETPNDFDISTGLERVGKARKSGKGRLTTQFKAPDYDVLLDCPMRIGQFESFGFKIKGVPFEISIFGADRDKTDRQAFAAKVKKISAHLIERMGDIPFKNYVYLFTIPGGGGLEHLNSTTIGLLSLRSSKPGRPITFDTIISHEFFHLWNVKRLRPEALGPFDYTGPNRTTALWLAEGVTSYYGAITMPRIGLWSARDYWNTMQRKFTRLRRNPARKKMSIAEVSWTVWDGRYRGVRNKVSYYLKGECLGMLLDILIRDATKDRKSLDDVMRGLYRQCMKDGKGFAEGDIRHWVEQVSGKDFSEFFERHVYGVEDLPVTSVLAKAGLIVTVTGEGRDVRMRIKDSAKANKLAKAIRNSLVGKD